MEDVFYIFNIFFDYFTVKNIWRDKGVGYNVENMKVGIVKQQINEIYLTLVWNYFNLMSIKFKLVQTFLIRINVSF